MTEATRQGRALYGSSDPTVAEAVRELAGALRKVGGVRDAQVVPLVPSEGAPELACFVVPTRRPFPDQDQGST